MYNVPIIFINGVNPHIPNIIMNGDTPTCTDAQVPEQITLNKTPWIAAWLPYVKPMMQVAIIPFVSALAAIDPAHTYAICATGVAALTIWLAFDIIRARIDIASNRSDLDASAEIQNIVDMHDRKAQAKILDGLQEHGIIPITKNMKTADLLAAQTTNNRIFAALLPSVHQNHHTHEISGKCCHTYVDKKVGQVMSAFTGRNEEYGILAQGLLGSTHLEDAVKDLVVKWVRDDIIPAIEEACKIKILYYQSLVNRKDVTKAFRHRAQEKLNKNNGYLAKIEEILSESLLNTKMLVHQSGIIPPAKTL